MAKTLGKRINPMAPYFVQMRELERQLITSTLTAARQSLPADAHIKKQLQLTAELLGVETAYLQVRIRVIGGVLDGAPKREPPGLATEEWLHVNNRRPRAPRLKPEEPTAFASPSQQPLTITSEQLVNDETYLPYVPTAADGHIIGEPLARMLGEREGERGNVLAFDSGKEVKPDA